MLVIGGGLAGLSCALALGERGLGVVLAERDRVLGGRARSFVDDATGDTVDIGPHVLLTEYPNMLHLLERVGTREHVVWDRDKVLTLVEDGRPIRIEGSRLPAPFHLLPSLLRVPSLPLRDLLSNHRTSWFVLRTNESDLRRIDDVDALTFLQRMKARPRLIDWFWATVSMTIMNVPLERCSAGALLRFYRILLANPDLRLGFPDIGLGELFVPGARAGIEARGGTVLTGREVCGLTVKDGRVTGARLVGGGRIEAEACVAAVEPQSLARLLPEELRRNEPFTALDHFPPSPYVSVYLWFDRKLTGERNWARTWSLQTLNYDCYDLSNIRRGWQQRPSVIASNIIYADRVAHLDDDAIVQATVRELAEFVPAVRRARIRHARVHRIPMAIPCPYPGLERRRPAPATPVGGLYLAGDWIDTGLPCSMEGAVRGGLLAAEALLAARNRPERLALDVPKTRGLLALTSRIGDDVDGVAERGGGLAQELPRHDSPLPRSADRQSRSTHMTTQKETLASWLKDAHAMKAARIENLDRQVQRLGEYPELKTKLEEHLGNSRRQMTELEGCLQRVGADPSALKEMTSKVASKLQGWTTSSAPDEAVKYLIANESFAEFEAASFDSLAAAAAQIGDGQMAETFSRMRDEERRTAEWFRTRVPEVTRRFLATQGAA